MPMLNVRNVFLLLVICAISEVKTVNVPLFPVGALLLGYVDKAQEEHHICNYFKFNFKQHIM